MAALTEESLRSALGEGMHTAFRKAGDSARSHQIWKLINDMPGDEWAAIVDFVASGVAVTLDLPEGE